MSIIKVQNLQKNFKLKKVPNEIWDRITSLFNPEYININAVNDVSFEVHQGESLAFIGPNGAGKSTVIKMLTGILFPTSGQITICGLNPQNRTQLAYDIGSVFGQKSQLWFHLPPLDTFDLIAHLYELNNADYKKRLDFLVQSFELESIMNTPVRKLSLGQRMKCEIAASLLHKPKIIFLDEPTIGLDVIAKQQVRDVLKMLNIQEGITLFLTSHDAGDIEAITHRTIIINHGKIIYNDSTENLRNNFIKSKIVKLVFEEESSGFLYDKGKILEKSKHSITIELATKRESIESLLSYALGSFTVLDVSIVDTPLEQIISDIYKVKQN